MQVIKYKIGCRLIMSMALATLSHPLYAQNETPLTRGGIIISDLTLDQVLISRDLDGDGKAESENEISVYFDETNQSGIPTPTDGAFAIHQGASGYFYVNDGNSDAVYRLNDANKDGDANDEGEAAVWISEIENAAELTLPTPNGVFEAEDGAVYIVNAGVSSRPDDIVYRTEDLNGDGDANDEGEATVWLDLGVLASELRNVDPNRSSAFDIAFIGNTAYIADTMGGEPDTIFSARDRNRNGRIDAGELRVFIDDENTLGVPVATGLTVLNKSLYVSESSTVAEQTVYKLTDVNKNGVIDDGSEAIQLWNESLVPEGVQLGSAFGLTITFDGEVYIASGGRDEADNVFRLLDLDGDGRYLSEGETIVWRSGNEDQAVEFARAVARVPDFLAAEGYYAASDVDNHNQVPSIIGEINDALSVIESGETPDYQLIKRLYTERQFGSVPTLQGFADGYQGNDPSKSFQAIFPQAVEYYGQADFLDAFLTSAIDGREDFSETSDQVRAAAISSGLLAIMNYWVRFELEIARNKAAAANFACPKGAPHNWDESFAFYYGPGGEHSIFALAESLQQAYRSASGTNRRMINFYNKGLDRLVPNRPAPG